MHKLSSCYSGNHANEIEQLLRSNCQSIIAMIQISPNCAFQLQFDARRHRSQSQRRPARSYLILKRIECGRCLNDRTMAPIRSEWNGSNSDKTALAFKSILAYKSCDYVIGYWIYLILSGACLLKILILHGGKVKDSFPFSRHLKLAAQNRFELNHCWLGCRFEIVFWQ